MARINVEDNILINPRFQALVRHVNGDMDRALGMLVRFWWLAQAHWGKDGGLVPNTDFNVGGFDPLIVVGLAEPRDNGVYARGAQEHFDWYRARIEAARLGGQKSAAKRKATRGSAVPDNARNLPKQNRSKGSVATEVTPKQKASKTEANATLYLYNTEQQPLSGDGIAGPILGPDPHPAPSGSDVWAAYAGAYLSRYGVAPVRNARTNTICANLVKAVGGDAAVAVARFYLTHNDAFYVRKSHDLGLCLTDCTGLHTQMLNGARVTQSHANQADRSQSNLDVFKRVAEKLAREREGGGDNGNGQ